MLALPILYEYALDARRIPRHIKSSNSVPPYMCGDCNGEMIARRGRVRQWHFAHKANVICASKPDPDNALHRYAQEIILEAFNRCKEDGSEYLLGVRCEGFNTDVCDGISGTYNISILGSELHKELSIVPGTRSDLVLIDSDGSQAILEVVNTHPLATETKERYRESEVPIYVRNLEWDTLHELSSAFIADDFLNIKSQPLCDRCAQKKELFKAERKRALVKEVEMRKKLGRRRRIIDSAVKRMVRTQRGKPQFRPWYKVKKESWEGLEFIMYPKTQRSVFANAIILIELGFEQHNPRKPWLFRFRIHKTGRYIYADLGGSDVVPIYEDTAAMLYAPDLDDDNQVEEYAVKRFAESLQSCGVDVRTGFLAPYDIDRKHVNPMKHIDRSTLNTMIKWVEKPEMTRAVQNLPVSETPKSKSESDPQQSKAGNSEAWRKLNEAIRKSKEEYRSN